MNTVSNLISSSTEAILLKTLGNPKKGSASDAFQEMLDTVMQKDLELPTGAGTIESGRENAKETDTSKKKPDDVDPQAQAAAAASQTEPQVQAEEVTVEDGEPEGLVTAQIDTAKTGLSEYFGSLEEPEIQELTLEAPEETILETETVISAETAGQPVQVAEADPETAIQQQTVVEEGQQRFDELISDAQKQLQELGGVIVEEPVEEPRDDHETSTQPVFDDGVELEPDQPEIPPAVTDTENAETGETVIQADLPKSQASIPVSNTQEQRPLKEMPKADETVLAMQAEQPVEKELPQAQTGRVERIEQSDEPQPFPITTQADQIQKQVAENLEQQRMEFRMQLQPQELGKIDVKMVLESGRLAVEIMAVNARTAEALTRQAESLVASLRMQSIDVQSVQIVTGSQETQAGFLDNMLNLAKESEGQGEQQTGTARTTAAENAEAEAAGSQSSGELNTLLDTTV